MLVLLVYRFISGSTRRGLDQWIKHLGFFICFATKTRLVLDESTVIKIYHHGFTDRAM